MHRATCQSGAFGADLDQSGPKFLLAANAALPLASFKAVRARKFTRFSVGILASCQFELLSYAIVTNGCWCEASNQGANFVQDRHDRLITRGQVIAIPSLLSCRLSGLGHWQDRGSDASYSPKTQGDFTLVGNILKFVGNFDFIICDKPTSSAAGDPYGNRTRVSAVKGPRPNR